MRVLLASEIQTDPTALTRAWEDRETFALLPERGDGRWSMFAQAADSLPAGWAEDHFALLTSGSTGEPKLVIGSRARAEALARILHIAQRSDGVRHAALALPLSYCYAFVNQWVWACVFGRPLAVTGGLAEPDRFGACLDGLEDAMLCLVGAQAPLVIEYFTGRTFPGVTRLHFAGGRFPQERLDAIRAVFPRAEVFNNFGCAEAMPRLTVLSKENGSTAANCIGEPLPGIELRAEAETGELQFRSVYGAVGFLDAAGVHAIAPEDWVPTGDLAMKDEADGQWYLSGRRSEVFKRYGEKVSLPDLLQTVLGEWPGQAAFHRERDPAGEEGHVLTLTPHPQPGEIRRVLEAIRRRHVRAQWPLRVDSVAALPLLPNGKVNTPALATLAGREVQWRQRL